MGKFVTAEADYNRGIEDITEEFRDSGNQFRATQLLLEHIKALNQYFKQIASDFGDPIPPKRFEDFHVSMSSALNDIIRATNAQMTYYATILNTGERDKFLADRSSELLKSSNLDTQKAAYMFAEITGQK
jgi:hypothetical protein